MLKNLTKNLIKKLIVLFCINVVQVVANSEDFYYKTIIFEQQLIHTVGVNPNKYRILNTTAMDITGKNTDYLAHIAPITGAVAAINGGFFRSIENNFFVPAGPLKVANNIWHGIGYQPRAAIGWFKDNNVVLMDRIKTKTSIKLSNISLPVSYFNVPYYIDQYNKYINTKPVLYSSIYHNFFNLNSKSSNLLIKQNNELVYIYQNNTQIKKLDISKADMDAAKVDIEVIPQLEADQAALWQKVDFITGGAPLLIKNYHELFNYSLEKLSYNFVYGKHNRTAVCTLDNGCWVFVVTASGITIPELVNVMQNLQCKDAINLDGGGSSSIYLSSKYQTVADFASIVNKITDAILILPK